MSYRVFAAGSRDAYRTCAAIDRELGYPRMHTEAEVSRRGAGPHAPIGTIRTETHTRPLVHADGRTAYRIDDTVRALAGRQVSIEDGGTRIVTISATETHADLPGGRVAWTAAEPRGGIAGVSVAQGGGR